MIKKTSLVFVFGLLIVFQLLMCSDRRVAHNSLPNIIYILADDLGIGDLSIYNQNSQIQTPNLDLMGKQGMVFSDAHTSSSVCTPTRYGILTGRYNWRTPLKEFVTWGNSPMLIKEDRLTVAELLQNHGYNTACIGKWHLGLNWAMKDGAKKFDYYSGVDDRVDFNQIDYSRPLEMGAVDLGFDYSFMIAASLNMPPYVYIENDQVVTEPSDISERKRPDYPYAHWIKGDISKDFDHEKVMPVLVDKTIDYIQKNAKADQPYFVYLPLPAPHNPILPLERWKGKSQINPYADFVIMIDDLIGDIFDAVKATGEEDNTWIIFTSDNGCAGTANFSVLHAAGHYPSYIYNGAKGSYLEGGHRVPFLVKWPSRIKSGTRCDQTICTADLMATCADILGYSLQCDEGEDSYSMMPLLSQKKGYKRKETIHHSKTGIFAIRQGDWKLIVSPNSGLNAAGKPVPPKNPLPEHILFDLKKDIGEKENVAESYPDKVESLKSTLIKLINNGRSTPGPKQKNDPITNPWPQAKFAIETL